MLAGDVIDYRYIPQPKPSYRVVQKCDAAQSGKIVKLQLSTDGRRLSVISRRRILPTKILAESSSASFCRSIARRRESAAPRRALCPNNQVELGEPPECWLSQRLSQ